MEYPRFMRGIKMSDDEMCELEYVLTDEEYADAEKMAKKHGYKTVGEFALYCMQRYLKEKGE